MVSDLHGKTALVTGGAGFIGSHIVDQLLAAGLSRVRVLDDFVRGQRRNLEAAQLTGRLEVTEGDIRDASLVDDLVKGSDYVFHQAALRITHCAEEPVKAVEVMINGTQNVLEASVRHGVTRVLAASSASVYGEMTQTPMDEDHPFNNRTLYGAAKIANEQMLRSYTDMRGLSYVALRPFNVYGPRMDVFGVYTEVMIRWLERLGRGQAPLIFGDGLQTMDFIYVEDVAREYILAATAGVSDVVLNSGTGIETSLGRLCTQLCAAAGRPDLKPEYQEARKVNAVTRRCAGVEKAAELIGFRAEVGLEEGLRRLIEWYAATPLAVTA